MSKRFSLAIGLLLVLVLACAGWGLWRWTRLNSDVELASRLIDDGQYRTARHQLRDVLWWQPSHPQANFLMAEALMLDDLLTATGEFEQRLDLVEQALAHLYQVPADAAEWRSQAMLKAGRLEFFERLRAHAALDAFAEATRLNPQAQEGFYWYWKISDLAGRRDWVYDEAWQTIELAPAAERPALLRHMYYSEFYPAVANRLLEVELGFLDPEEMPTDQTPTEIYATFIRNEPASPYGYSALARWVLERGDPTECMKILDEAIESCDAPYSDPLLLAVTIDALNDLGQLKVAADFFAKWPESQHGFHFWRCKALLDHKLHRDYESAIEAYENACSVWPGPVQWHIWNLRADCLREAGRPDDAKAVTQQAQQIQRLMEDDVHNDLANCMENLESPEALDSIIRFYTSLGMTRETNAWQTIRDRLD